MQQGAEHSRTRALSSRSSMWASPGLDWSSINSLVVMAFLLSTCPPNRGKPRIYLTTFVLVGFYWQSHLFMASRFVRSDATHRWLQLGSLMGVALLPFVNDLLELMPLQATIQIAYSLVLVQIGFFDRSWGGH